MADGDILDFISNNWQSMLGIGPASAAPAAPPPPPAGLQSPMSGGALGNPTPVQTVSYTQQNAGPQASPAPPPDPRSRDFGPGMTFQDRAGPIQFDLANGATDTQGMNHTDFSPQPIPGPPPRPPVQVPMPDSTPGMQAGAGPMPQTAPNAAPMPPTSAMSDPGAPVTNTAGGLGSAMGLNPNSWGSMLAGIGKGLTAVGAQRPGTFGMQSFAAGAGGGLTGSNEQNQRNQAQARQQQNDLFNQKSQAFKDWAEGEKLGDEKKVSAARAKYFEAFAAQKTSGMTGNAFAGTTIDAANKVERMVLLQRDQWRKELEAKWKLKASTPEEIDKDLAELEKRTTDYRAERAKGAGIDPNEYKRGTSKDLPFEFDKLTPQQRLMLPDGAFYRYRDPSDPKADKDGYVYKKRDYLQTPPYEGWEPSGNGAQQQQQQQQQQRQTPQVPSPQQVEYGDQAVMGG